MKTMLSGLGLDECRAPRDQVRDFIRELIHTGKLQPGERLPATETLASHWKTYVPAVHAALTALVKEGLLVRQHGRGTFVRKREEKLTCVGIYYPEDIWTKHSSDFQRTVHAALKEELHRLGVRTQVWVDPRPLAEQAHEWTELRRAAEKREIQGLIVTQGCWPRTHWLNKLPVPSAHIGTANIPNRVVSDLPQLAELSLRCLAKQGCRSVGLICPIPATMSSPDGSQNVFEEFLKRFTDWASDLELIVRNEWMRIPNPKQPIRSTLTLGELQEQQEHYGYEEFLKLWSQPRRPEGLVIYPDTMARGVILGVQQKQVRVPAELRLAIAKNEDIPLLCPMPATFLVSSERAFARALIEQVQKQFRGEPCEPVNVPFRLMAHPAVEPPRSGARRGNSPGRTNHPTNRERS